MKNLAHKHTSIDNHNAKEFKQDSKQEYIKAPVLFISIIGTVLEYFEYAIYGFLAPILALHFFPEGDSTAALLKTFGVFAVGSLSKPLGAVIFGYLGDLRGRRISLRYSMVGISFPTFIVGMLPGYETLGWGSALALVACRIMQGIFIAGESDGVRIYVFEHFGKIRPCFMITLVGCGAYIGIAIASFVATKIPPSGEAWRFVFLGCSLCGILVFILRRYLIETPQFLAYQQAHHEIIPLMKILKSHWREILRTIMICGANGGAYHFFLVFQGTYLAKILHIIPENEGTLYGFFLTSVYVLTLPLAAWTADTWGLARVSKIAGVLTIGLVIINILMVYQKLILFPLLIMTTIALAFFFAPGYLFLMQQYEVGIRFRGLSLGHAVGSMLFSGTTPFVCLVIWQQTNLAFAPFIYFTCLLFMAFFGFTWGKKWKKGTQHS
jgi:MHS family proline/betaine transporter-like MFS transporter